MSNEKHSDIIASKEKNSVALTSVFAAVGLTIIKLVVGVLTGSLGILSEAAHSGLDLVAALVTLFAVRISDKPADDSHHFGHGKVENFSALIETLLLLVTCVWIIYEAYQRLFVKEVEVEASFWAFLIMGVSIVVDINRSRMLKKAAVKYNSQALEADALHFSTDIWSSSVVILGLIGVKIASLFPKLQFLVKADAVAALGVSIIVIVVSLQLGKRSIAGLLDTAPQNLKKDVVRVIESFEGVEEVHKVRLLPSGANLFIDAHLVVDGSLSLADVHQLMDAIEKAVNEIAPDADITIHPEPI